MEMLVVLSILAVLTTLAIQLTDQTLDQGRTDITIRQIERINDSIVGHSSEYQVDGTPIVRGFVADVGRRPYANIDPQTPVDQQLSELCYGGALPQGVRMCRGPTLETIDTSDISLDCGWKGPYVLPTQLRDGWGRPLKPRIEQSSNLLLAIDSEGRTDPNRPLPVIRELQHTGMVNVTLRVQWDDQSLVSLKSLSAAMLYPNPDLTSNELATQVFTQSGSTSPQQLGFFQFVGIPVGLRAVKAVAEFEYDHDNDPETPAQSLTPKMYAKKYVIVPREGLNGIVLTIPKPSLPL